MLSKKTNAVERSEPALAPEADSHVDVSVRILKAAGSEACMVQVTLGSAAQSVTVETDQTIAVLVEENPTTGYQWEIEALTGPLTLVSSDFQPAAGATPGRGGRRTIVTRAGGRGSGELRIRSVRSWEGASSDSPRRTLTVTVE
jgi:inhibitor of cysteine peptidase